jgi:hypothetical protein
MSGLELAASIFAVITVCDRIISLTSKWISAREDAPKDLKLIEIEALSLRSMLESLDLSNASVRCPSSLNLLCSGESHHGLVDLGKSYLIELESELVEAKSQSDERKRHKLEISLKTLAWPARQKKTHQLLQDVEAVRQKILFIMLNELRSTSILMFLLVRLKLYTD